MEGKNKTSGDSSPHSRALRAEWYSIIEEWQTEYARKRFYANEVMRMKIFGVATVSKTKAQRAVECGEESPLGL